MRDRLQEVIRRIADLSEALSLLDSSSSTSTGGPDPAEQVSKQPEGGSILYPLQKILLYYTIVQLIPHFLSSLMIRAAAIYSCCVMVAIIEGGVSCLERKEMDDTLCQSEALCCCCCSMRSTKINR